MIKIYTPSEWHAFFSCPSLIIDQEGSIYNADAYNNWIRHPIGKIDYQGGYIYGKDYNALLKTPIAYMVPNDDVTKVYKHGSSIFSAPMLYITKDAIYTADEYTRILGGTPCGYTKKELDPHPGKEKITKHETDTPSRYAPANTDVPGFAFILGTALFIGAIYILTSEARIADAAAVIAAIENIAMALYLLLKKLRGELHFDWNRKHFFKGLGLGVGIYVGATAVLVLLGMVSHIGSSKILSDAASNKMEIAAMFMGLPCVIGGLFKETR